MAGPHCPACGAPTEPEARFCRECGAPFGPPSPELSDPLARADFTVGEAIGFGWRTTRANLPFLVGVSLLYFVISITMQIGLPELTSGSVGAQFAANILSLAVGAVFSVGVLTICFKLYDSQRPSLRDLIPRSDLVVRYLFVSLVVGLMTMGGLILLIVPGVIIFLRFGYAPYLVVDRGVGLREALRGSSRITSGVKWRLLGLALASAGVLLLGFMCLFVGILVAFPVVQLASTFAYRRLVARAEIV